MDGHYPLPRGHLARSGRHAPPPAGKPRWPAAATDDLYIAPTVLVDVSPDSPIMQDEIFGPILPVLEIDSVEKVIDWVNERPEPLGLYVFSGDDDVTERSSRRRTRVTSV